MDASIRQSIPPLPDAETDLLPDRRRPGRAEIDPVLVPLLREPGHTEFAEIEPGPFLDDLGIAATTDRDGEGNVAKGIVVALLLSLPFWLVAAFVGFMVLR